jgi:CRISPR-associated RAMP protein (TIGR02581 family)
MAGRNLNRWAISSNNKLRRFSLPEEATMLKQLVNECVIDLAIQPDGPILIKSGMPTISGPDMAFVTTFRNGDWEVYLPGSSLKGTFRSHAERIARTLNEVAACNPFESEQKRGRFCGHVFEKRKKDKDWPDKDADRLNQLVYHDSCPICRLFGSTWFAGRLATADAYAEGKPPRPQQRDGVGIDRFTGGAAQGVKFDMEVVTEGTFITQLHLRNFELWQLGLVGFVLTDFADGLIRVGAAKSRGLGRVRGTVRQVRLDFLGSKAPQPENGQVKVKGVGDLISPDITKLYGMATPDEVSLPAVEPTKNGLRTTYRYDGVTFPWAVLGPLWVQKAERYETSEEMARYRDGKRR